MKKFITLFLIVLLCGIVILLQSYIKRRVAKVKAAENETAAIRNAVIAYRDEYGVPLSPNNDVFQVLSGSDNLRKICFMSHADPDHWAENRYIDPWGQPYFIDLTLPDKPKVLSWGPDGYQSTDDIISR